MRALAGVALLLAAGCRGDGVTDLDGHAVDPLAGAGGVTVLVFASPSCPISNRYAPTVARLHRRFSPRAVAFALVYPDGETAADTLRQHAREHGYPFPALRDPRRALAHRSAATVTPEAAVFVGRKLTYHGRIDDRFIDFGKERPAPTREDLAEAIEAALAGRPPPAPSAPALGCAIPGDSP
jgi:hypothetical protein